MEETTAPVKATDTLLPKVVTVSVGETDYRISEFRFGKMVRALALVTEVAASAGIEDATKKLMGSGDSGDGITISGIISQVLTVLPKMLHDGVPALYKLVGLIVTPNKDLYKLEVEDEADVDAVLFSKGREIAWDGTSDEVMGVLNAGVQQVGVETILKNALPLVRTLLNRQQK